MKRPNTAFFMPESTADRKARLARDVPQARAAYEAERAAIDARTVKLRELRLARDAEDAAKAPVPGPKPKKRKATTSAAAAKRADTKSSEIG